MSAMLRLAALFALLAVVTSITITDFAVPKSIPVNENAELQCRYTLDAGEDARDVVVKWWWRPVDADAAKTVYQRIADNAPSSVHGNIEIKGNDTLVLTSLQPADSGEFECEVSCDLNESRRKQGLTVYTEGSGPILNVTDDDPDDDEEDEDPEDVKVVICEASEAAPRPELVITIDNVPLNATQVLSDLPGGLYNITANATLPAAAEGVVRCELFYEDDSISHPAYFDTLTLEVAGGAGAARAAPSSPEPEPEPEDATAPHEMREESTDGASIAMVPALLLLAATLLQLCL